MRQSFLSASALCLVAVPALAFAQTAPQDAPQDADEQEASEPASQDAAAAEAEVIVTAERKKRVCREITPIGSRVPQKICRTVDESLDDMRATREVMDELRMDGAPLNEDQELFREAAARVGQEGDQRPR